jgi:CDP-diacylglycerol---glycerol-3-phosphate 3-phosphatidyltransferase
MAFMSAPHHIACPAASVTDYNGAGVVVMLNLPNALSLVRIVLVPLLVVVLLTPPRSWAWTGVGEDLLGAAIFGLASLTDLLDGWIARRRRQVTAIGEWLDPLADKLLITGALISLVQLDRVPAWIAAVIIGRELAVTGLRSVAHSRGVSMPASSLGKFKMAAQVTAILGLILAPQVPSPLDWVGTVALWVMLVFALWSAVDYYRRFSDVLREQ